MPVFKVPACSDVRFCEDKVLCKVLEDISKKEGMLLIMFWHALCFLFHLEINYSEYLLKVIGKKMWQGHH